MGRAKLVCGWCKYDPVHSGAKCCPKHNLIVCSCCKGTDSYIKEHPPTNKEANEQ